MMRHAPPSGAPCLKASFRPGANSLLLRFALSVERQTKAAPGHAVA